MIIQRERTIAEVQQEFNDLYPYLRAGFFTHGHNAGTASEFKSMIQETGMRLGEIGLLEPGEIAISPEMTVRALEQEFEQKYGLHVQIFRKSGHAWLETSRTDHLTLAEQNERGRIADHHPVIEEDPIDYREQE